MRVERDPARTGAGQYRAALTDPLVLSVFLRTFRICLIVTFATVCGCLHDHTALGARQPDGSGC
jgi:ABC-type spermidine/putrescine transport system permease subunit I